MTDSVPTLTAVESDADGRALRDLLVEFHEWMDRHAEDSFDPERELAEDLRSLESESEAWAWIARVDGIPAGCVLLYGVTEDLAEFKRLWVRPSHRGTGIGRKLTRRVLEAARKRGYGRLGLTTPPWSEAAHELYESMGFERTPPYPESRLPERYYDDAIFMMIDPTDASERATDE